MLGAWWLMPGLTLGVALYVRSKRKAGKVRWIEKTEEELKKLPAGLIMAKLLDYGDELPQPPEGFKWREITMLISTTPISAPEELVVHVLDPIFQNGEGLLPVHSLEEPGIGSLGSTYLTTQQEEASPHLGYFLTEQYLQTAPHLGGISGLAPRDEAMALHHAFHQYGKRLQHKPPTSATVGDVVVTPDCQVWFLEGIAAPGKYLLKGITGTDEPTWFTGDFQCVFDVVNL